MEFLTENKLRRMSVNDLYILESQIAKVISNRYQDITGGEISRADYEVYKKYRDYQDRVSDVIEHKSYLNDKYAVAEIASKRAKKEGADFKRNYWW